MKSLLKTSLVVIGISAGALSGLNAQTTPATVPGPAPTALANAAPRPGAFRRAVVRRHLIKRLGLSQDQVAQLNANRANAAAAIKAIRDDSTLTPDQRRAKIRETWQAARAQMHAVLTPDQQAKLDEIRAEWRAARGL